MAKLASKREFLTRVTCPRVNGRLPPLLTTHDEYVRENIRTACEALSLGLIRLARDIDGLGHVLRSTPAGNLLLADKVEEAAAEIDSGRTIIRITGPEPAGTIAMRLQPGQPGMPVDCLAARTHAPEIMRCIASGHIAIKDGTLSWAKPAARPVWSPMTSNLAERNLQAGPRRRVQGGW